METVTPSNSFAGPPSNAIACERKVDLADGTTAETEATTKYIFGHTQGTHIHNYMISY